MNKTTLFDNKKSYDCLSIWKFNGSRLKLANLSRLELPDLGRFISSTDLREIRMIKTEMFENTLYALTFHNSDIKLD